MIFNPTYLTTTAVALLSIVTTCIASDDPKTSRLNRNPQMTLGTPHSTLINCNNIAAWYNSNGEQERDPNTGNPGLWYPRGTGTAIYAAGLIWGGKFRDGITPALRVNGQMYSSGTKPGAILGIRTGIAEDPNSPDVRIWRIRKDYATIDLRQDASEFFNIYRTHVTQAQIDSVRRQYEKDWREWPWQKGAPFYDVGYRSSSGLVVGANNGVLDWGEDANRNGLLDPGEDSNNNGLLDAEKPGLAGADQVIWYVCNDIGVAQPWTCPTSGIEQQTTIWGYARNDALGDVVFKRFRLIYKGIATTPDTARIDSMYIGQFSDPDLGAYTDDFVGCDTNLDLAYVYNGQPIDAVYSQFGLPPPSVGYTLLQGPLVQTGVASDTGVFNFQKMAGAINKPMTSFVYVAYWGAYCLGFPSYTTAIGYFQVLRGLPGCPIGPPDPPPFINPVTGQPTHFWLDGDPVTGTGWIDGRLDPPGDRQMYLNTGPFNMALGDTQEVIIAVVGGLGSTNINSITAMRATTRAARSISASLFQLMPPNFSIRLSYPNTTTSVIAITADGRPARARTIEVSLKRQNNTPLATFDLYDDGLHGDGYANDGIFGNSVTVGRELNGLFIDARSTDEQNRLSDWGRMYDRIAIAGEVATSGPFIFSDNFNNDRKANPGENIRYGFSITNRTQFPLSDLSLSAVGEQTTIRVAQLGSGGQFSISYNSSNPTSYFVLSIPSNHTDEFYRVAISIRDTNSNEWRDTLKFRVHQFLRPPDTVAVQQISGENRGAFQILLVDPLAMKNHQYVIRGVSVVPLTTSQGIMLKDSTDGRILFMSQPIPDSIGHGVPYTDGFKVLRGSFDPKHGMIGHSHYGTGTLWTSDRASGYKLEGFGGAMGMAFGKWLSSSTILPDQLKSIVFRFANTNPAGSLIDPNDTTASFAYRYLRNASRPAASWVFEPFMINRAEGYPYQDFRRSVPFAAYDTTTTPPRRLAVGFLENNVVGGLVDGKYWPPRSPTRWNTDSAGAQEFFFIFDAPYRQTPDTQFQVDISTVALPIIWWGTPTRSGSVGFSSSGRFLIIGRRGINASDSWIFKPTLDQIIPPSYALAQNYPNPFNPNTTIEYDLPSESHVRMKVYNILGQEVRTLVDEIQAAQYRTVQWDGTNGLGNRVASGVYFYRMEATSIASPGQTTVKVKKMALVR